MQFMGVIEEVGADVKKVKVGQRYVCCFDIGCGECFYCKHNLFSCCMRSNPSNMTCGLYGHKLGGFYGAPLHMSLQKGFSASIAHTSSVYVAYRTARRARVQPLASCSHRLRGSYSAAHSQNNLPEHIDSLAAA